MLVEALEEHVDSAAVQELGAGALLYLAFDEPGAEVDKTLPLIGEPGVKALLAGMERHPLNGRVLTNVCGALANLTSWTTAGRTRATIAGRDTKKAATFRGEGGLLSPHCVEAVIRHGGMRLVVHALQALPNEIGVLANGCEVLSHLARGKEHRAALCDVGAIEVLLGTIRRHPESEAITEHSSMALGFLAEERFKVPPLQVPVVKEIGRLLAMEIIVRGMKLHVECEQLQANACKALANLSLEDVNRKLLVDEPQGGIETIVHVMKEHHSSPKVAANGSEALANVAKSVRFQETVALKGGIDAVLNAMRMHHDRVDVLEMAVAAVHHLSQTASNRPALGKRNACQALCVVLNTSNSEEGKLLASELVTLHCCGAVAQLALEPICKALFVRSKGFDSVVHAMASFEKSEQVQKFGCAALEALA